MPKSSPHVAVLTHEVLRLLSPNAGDSYLDVTAGYGGHAQAVLQSTKAPLKAVLIDRDRRAADYLKQKFAGSGAKVIKSDFLSASRQLARQGKTFNLILADLGVSSPHLDDARRGFSFEKPGPLDMRMDQNQVLTAAQIVNEWDGPELSAVIARYGEEPRAAHIAEAIIASRPVGDTRQLARIVAAVMPRRQKLHPATKTFQGLRIAVNAELVQLEESLPIWLGLLTPGGRMAVISFHSLEDRIVKHFFAQFGGNTYDAELTVLTPKPVTAKPDEIVHNPRARSAKLRACQRK
ncbi:16S rRNA (cytosine(1402)-N(4))-methyltransferase [Candidatus Saccharibacteria bacterium RIFCSPHIGHO2_12_FULL_49_19]|nr:MAG: 16S rRNA (cytosine(1402)-N(4))-methyltransferase [Candidatus Saccharibacteria bacterium RIFCSPHIGHO2_01_FULL_49_21]OGL36221.1 MAG: 16S rRNA (cytosine(1402)-N(4))-methyltransferase [Candidatus Saccharibacteria bacterium RIFCSPHIGHO2_12_FULL_49_19]OGL37321.1 MAG: 16S rRNA (cytosine(1402)-N(4))-methyltransferase [Candidatus Saccharibacteria bacterium RIFCSPLOWO2_01_FULL_49_22]